MSSRRTGDQIEERVSIDSNQPLEIQIENQSGDVSVRGTDRTDVLIRAEKHGSRGSVAYQEAELLIEVAVEADQARIAVRPALPPEAGSGPNVSVDLGLDLGLDFIRDFLDPGSPPESRRQRGRERREGKRRSISVSWDNSDISYEIELEVPKSVASHLTIKTASGDLSLADLTGSAELNTASGDASVKRFAGDLILNTASGDLSAIDCTGQLTVRSASGDARIERSALNALAFRTASGDLHLDAALVGEGPFQIETASGDSQLALAAPDPASDADRSITLAFQSMSGDARLDQSFAPRGGGRWATNAAQPGPHLDVRTVSGDLRGAISASREARAHAREAGERLRQAATAVAAASMALAQTPIVPPSPPVPATPPTPVVPPTPSMPATPPTPPTPPVPPVAPARDPELVEPQAAARTDDATPDAVHTGGLAAAAPTPAREAERLALLEAVERGEIDIDEALQRLEDRDDQPPVSE